MDTEQEGLAWQIGVWNRISEVYLREIDARFAPVVGRTLAYAQLVEGDAVLDIGTGTGALAFGARRIVGANGSVTAIDISPDMLGIAERRGRDSGFDDVGFREGRTEQIPAEDAAFDVICSSLCFQYVIDRTMAAAECARVLRPGGRFVATVWGGPEDSDIVLFQATAGRFAPKPPLTGVGPGALADPTAFLRQLDVAGISAQVETETTVFEFSTFDQAWDVLAGVTTASLPPERVVEAKQAVREAMWSDANQPRIFSNKTQFIVGSLDR